MYNNNAVFVAFSYLQTSRLSKKRRVELILLPGIIEFKVRSLKVLRATQLKSDKNFA